MRGAPSRCFPDPGRREIPEVRLNGVQGRVFSVEHKTNYFSQYLKGIFGARSIDGGARDCERRSFKKNLQRMRREDDGDWLVVEGTCKSRNLQTRRKHAGERARRHRPS